MTERFDAFRALDDEARGAWVAFAIARTLEPSLNVGQGYRSNGFHDHLGRLLGIYEELRENSQLLVITHQKRTMEVGDALYGVTMRGDGVSAVISQRLREAESA